MLQQKRPGGIFPYRSILPIVVVRELCQVAGQARALYVSDDWEFVRGSLYARSRAEAARPLRAVALVAWFMAGNPELGGRRRRRALDQLRAAEVVFMNCVGSGILGGDRKLIHRSVQVTLREELEVGTVTALFG
jgi:hypothetical protein